MSHAAPSAVTPAHSSGRPAGTPTAADIVQELPFTWGVQGRIFLIGGLGFMFDAWDVTLNGVLAPLLLKHWKLDPSQLALIGTANLVGMGIGAFAWGAVADKLGRKKAFSLTLAMFGLFTVLGGLAPNYELFLLMRFFAGMGLGGCIPVDYALVGEFTPRKVRGRILTAMDGWWPIGSALCGFSSAWLMAQFHDWRVLMFVMILPVLLIAWVRLSVPESPLFLAKMGREAEARKVVDRLVATTGAEPRAYVLDAPQTEASGPVDLLRRVWAFDWKRTAVAWALFVTILLAYYITLMWMPKILVGAGFAEAKAFLTTAGMSGVGLLGVIVSALLVEKVGRRPLLALSAPLAMVCLAVASLDMKNPSWVTAWLLAYGFLIQISIPVLYTYVSELYPTSLRASGFGWASAASRVAAGFGPLLFVGTIWPMFGITAGFWILGGLIVAALALMFLWAPETKGVELD